MSWVIIGGGQAGAWLTRTLREEGYAGPLTLLAAEPCWPYERPALSKAFLQGKADIAAMTLLDETLATALDIDVRLGCAVTAIDRTARDVVCANGERMSYDRLFLATGGAARRLPGLPEGVHVLRTQQDASALREELRPGRKLLVLGGGWIGLEVAATARGLGCEVVLVEAETRLCARSLPATIAAELQALHVARGVKILTGARVQKVTQIADSYRAVLGNGQVIEADLVLAALGLAPAVELAERAGLVCANGIVVDELGRTSDPAIFAAGDVTSQPYGLTGCHRRLESWANAQNQAIRVARAALGLEVTPAEIPWLWSDQYELTVQMLGMPEQGTTCILRMAADGAGRCWMLLDETGNLVGSVAFNAPREFRTLSRLMAAGKMPVPGAWANMKIAMTRLECVSRKELAILL